MKKTIISRFALIVILVLMGLMCSCANVGNAEDIEGVEDDDKENDEALENPKDPSENQGEEKKELFYDGEYYTIFGESAKNNFDIVYPSNEKEFFAQITNSICEIVKSNGIESVRSFADGEKEEAMLEILIGDTNRALSEEAKSTLDAKITENPDAMHWIWLYRDGQLALYANSEYAYRFGIYELTGSYYHNGMFGVLDGTCDITFKYLLPECILAKNFENDMIIPMIHTIQDTIIRNLKDDNDAPVFDFLNEDGEISSENRDSYGSVDMRKLKDYLVGLSEKASTYCESSKLSDIENLVADAIALFVNSYSIKNPNKYNTNDSYGKKVLEQMYKAYPITKEGEIVYAVSANISSDEVGYLKRRNANILKELCPLYSIEMMYEAEKACGIGG